MKKMSFVILWVLVLCTGCSRDSMVKDGSGELIMPSMPIIDAHTHLDDLRENPDDIKKFTDNGVIGAVAHSSRVSLELLELKDNPAFKVKLCAAIQDKSTVQGVESYLKQGRASCMKIFLGYVPMFATDPFYLPFYALAEQYDVPVVFHTGDTSVKNVFIKYADPLTVDEVAVLFPKVNFVLAHMGNPWFDSAAEVVYKNDNVWTDTSALMLGDIRNTDQVALEELIFKPIRWMFHYVENPRKFLFGTDWPLVDVKGYIQVIAQAFPEEHWPDVFHDNAQRLFKF